MMLDFAAEKTTHTASVRGNVSGVRVMPVARDPNAAIRVDGMTVASGAQSNEIALTADVPKKIVVDYRAKRGGPQNLRRDCNPPCDIR